MGDPCLVPLIPLALHLPISALLSLNYGSPHLEGKLGVRLIRMGIRFSDSEVDDVHTKWFMGESCAVLHFFYSSGGFYP